MSNTPIAARGPPRIGQAMVTIVDCQNLPETNFSGTCDAYCKVSISGFCRNIYQTPVISNTRNPSFPPHAPFAFDVYKPTNIVTVHVHSQGTFSDDDLGEATMLISDMPAEATLMTARLPIVQRGTSHQNGSVRARFQYIPEPQSAHGIGSPTVDILGISVASPEDASLSPMSNRGLNIASPVAQSPVAAVIPPQAVSSPPVPAAAPVMPIQRVEMRPVEPPVDPALACQNCLKSAATLFCLQCRGRLCDRCSAATHAASFMALHAQDRFEAGREFPPPPGWVQSDSITAKAKPVDISQSMSELNQLAQQLSSGTEVKDRRRPSFVGFNPQQLAASVTSAEKLPAIAEQPSVDQVAQDDAQSAKYAKLQAKFRFLKDEYKKLQADHEALQQHQHQQTVQQHQESLESQKQAEKAVMVAAAAAIAESAALAGRRRASISVNRPALPTLVEDKTSDQVVSKVEADKPDQEELTSLRAQIERWQRAAMLANAARAKTSAELEQAQQEILELNDRVSILERQISAAQLNAVAASHSAAAVVAESGKEKHDRASVFGKLLGIPSALSNLPSNLMGTTSEKDREEREERAKSQKLALNKQRASHINQSRHSAVDDNESSSTLFGGPVSFSTAFEDVTSSVIVEEDEELEVGGRSRAVVHSESDSDSDVIEPIKSRVVPPVSMVSRPSTIQQKLGVAIETVRAELNESNEAVSHSEQAQSLSYALAAIAEVESVDDVEQSAAASSEPVSVTQPSEPAEVSAASIDNAVEKVEEQIVVASEVVAEPVAQEAALPSTESMEQHVIVPDTAADNSSSAVPLELDAAQVFAQTPSSRFVHKLGALLLFAGGHIGLEKSASKKVSFRITELTDLEKEVGTSYVSNTIVFHLADQTKHTLRNVCLPAGQSGVTALLSALTELSQSFHHKFNVLESSHL